MAESKSETYHRHGEPDPSQWDEAVAVTGREADAVPENSSFADRAKAIKAENKQVQSAEAKSDDDEDDAPKRTKRTTRKSTSRSKK